MQLRQKGFSFKRVTKRGLILDFLFINFLFIFFISCSRNNFFYEHFENFGLIKTSWTLTTFLFIFVSYWLLFFGKKERLNKKEQIIIGLIALFSFLTPPFLSMDVGAYLIGAKNFVWFHVNPYLNSLDGVNGNAWLNELGNIWWLKQPFSYGPIFLAVVSISVLPNFFHLISAVFFYKIIVFGGYIFSIFIFYKIIKLLEYDKFLVVLFAVNPAILVNGIIDGHNEVFVILMILLVIYFLAIKKEIHGYLFWLCSIFIKYNTLILLPIFWKKNKEVSFKKMILSILGVLVSFVLMLSVFNLSKNGLSNSFVFLKNQQNCLYRCSPIISLTDIISGGEGGLLRVFLFLVFYVLVFYRFVAKDDESLKFIFWSFLGLMFIFTKWMTPWYPIAVIPVGMLIKGRVYQFLVIGITAYSLFHFFSIL